MKKLISAAFMLLCANCISISADKSLQPYTEKTLAQGSGPKILIIYIQGVISDSMPSSSLLRREDNIPLTAKVREQLEAAERDPEIKSVILSIDSPGGEVTTCDIIHHEIMSYKKRTGVPVTVIMGSVAASGGYYLSMTGDTVIAYPTTITGSIGVLITKLSLKELLGKIGIEDETVKSGENKTMGSFFKNMSPDEKALFQKIVDSMYGRFIDIILESRKNITRDQLLKVADGRIFIASDALKLGLIDKIGYFEDAVEAASKSAGLTNPKIVTFIRPGTYRPNIYSGAQSQSDSGIQALTSALDLFTSKYGTCFMYLWKD